MNRLFLRSLAFCTFVLAAAGSIATADAEDEPDPAIAYAGFVAGSAETTRISLDFDRPIEVDLRFSNEPARLVLELPPTAFRLGKPLQAGSSPAIAKIGYDQSEPSRSRLIFELDRPVRVARRSVKPLVDANGAGVKGSRLVLDLAPTTEEAFAKFALAAPVEPAIVREETVSPSSRPLILLDPGHGGIDGGAIGRRRTVEKDVTLTFARTLQAALKRTGRFEVGLTRTRDVFVSLKARVAKARDRKAALFVSIHADSLRQRRIRGATVYTLSDEASDEVSRDLASEQNRVGMVAGLELPKLDTGAADILFDLMQRETDDLSARIAEEVVGALGTATRLIGNPNRSADFFVLRSPDVPSILLELGYLSNEADEKLLASKEWQKKVAAALANALATYFADRGVAPEK